MTRKEVCKRYYSKHRDKILIKEKIIRTTKEGKFNRWAIRLKHLWGLSVNDFNKMFEAQNGVCAICGKPEITTDRYGNVKRISIDHNHKTKKIRKLLCSNCNRGLGLFKDNKENLLRAALYLEEFE